jgi:hypothetical protein
MKNLIVAIYLFLGIQFYSIAQKKLLIKNEQYEIAVSAPKQIKVKTLEKKQIEKLLSATILLQYSENQVFVSQSPAKEGGYPVTGWKKNMEDKVAENNPFKVVENHIFKADKVVQNTDNQFTFSFPDTQFGKLSLQVSLPQGAQAPRLEIVFESKKKGYYSFAFNGLQAQDTAQIQYLYQPLVWSWRRFPTQPYLTPETYCTTAATYYNTGTYNEGIAPDPAEIPYRYAFLKNSKFGLSIRNQEGKAQPMLFAPILGGEGSLLSENQIFNFKIRYLLKEGDWYEGYQFILNNIFSYKNERQNATVTLNQTLDNMINFAMNDVYGGWVDSLKGFDYVQDAVGTVKIVSALHQLGTALVTGNEEIYRKRALPTIEYALSREKYLYSIYDEQKVQSPSRLMKGPCVEIGELAGLDLMTKGQSAVFQAEINRIFGKSRKLNLNTETGGGSWQDYFARYRASKNPEDLQKARQGADEYLKGWQPYPNVFTNDPGLRDKEAAFLTDFTPKLYDLFELYQETQDRKYLESSLVATRQMLSWLRSNPLAPAGNIVVNKGGKIKGIHGKRYKINSYEYLKTFYDTNTVAEQEIEAWRTSLVGLPPEQPRTYNNGPIMLTHHPAWLLRLAHESKDTLLRDVAYNAVLGRYANFPGYYFNSFETNIYQSASYPMHNYWDMRYNSMFYNHVFPHITLLIDFLVSDVYYRSEGKIDFPSVYAPGYAYLTSKVYGNKTGKIFDNEGVRLWLPPNAIQSSSIAFNHVLGIGEKDFYLVLTNTSKERIQEKVRLNQDVITWKTGKKYEVIVYQANGKQSQTTMQNGIVSIDISAQGLTALKIIDLQIDVPLFRDLDEVKKENKQSKHSFFRDENTEFLGTLTGMIINTFPQFSDVYIFTDKTEKELRKVVLYYQIDGGEWQSKTELGYPFEFSLSLKNPKSKVEFYLQATDLKGVVGKSKTYLLTNE